MYDMPARTTLQVQDGESLFVLQQLEDKEAYLHEVLWTSGLGA